MFKMELKRATATLKFNTKGCCFLCLKSEDNYEKEIDNETRQSISIRDLLQHLQISLNGFLLKEDVKVDLCNSCEKTLNGFSNVFEDLKIAQMKMNYWLEKINKCISGSKGSQRVHVYSKRMTNDPETLTQLVVVDNLRKKLAVKSLKTRVSPIPCVKLKRTELQNQLYCKIKKEEDSFREGFNDDSETIDFHNPTLVLNGSFPKPEAQKAPASSTAFETHPRKAGVRRGILQHKYYTKDAKTGLNQCKKCDRTCRKTYNMIRHYQLAHLEKRYPCDICKKAKYSDFHQLRNHKKSCRETIEKRLAKENERENFKFVCNSCGKKFRTRDVLVHHEKVHSTIRYPCNFCGKKFTKMCNLKRHQEAVHLGKVYFCKFCNKQVVYKDYLRTHEKNCKLKIKIEPQD